MTSGVMWHDMDPYVWLNKFYSCYMETVAGIVNGHGLGIKHVVETSPVTVSLFV